MTSLKSPARAHVSTSAHDAIEPMLRSFLTESESRTSSKVKVKYIYTTNASWPYHASGASRKRCRIVVTDSSFSPPHVGHIALCRAGEATSTSRERDANTVTSRLLLFSMTNADKGSPDIESVSHRVEMMRLLAPTLDRSDQEDGGTCVCVVREPIIVDKCTLLRESLLQEGLVKGAQDLSLVIVCGWDTLIRFLNPKYYSDIDSSMTRFFVDEQCELVCARRGGMSSKDEEQFWDDNPKIRKWRKHVKMVDLDPSVANVSSTAIREAFKTGDRSRTEDVPEVVERYIREHDLYKS